MLAASDSEAVRELARDIRAKESAQSVAVTRGTTLRQQLGLAEFVEARERDPSLTFRQHLSGRGGAIEV